MPRARISVTRNEQEELFHASRLLAPLARLRENIVGDTYTLVTLKFDKEFTVCVFRNENGMQTA
jgi:hypothetical protein